MRTVLAVCLFILPAFLNAKIVTVKDVDVATGVVVPASSEVLVMGERTSAWYEVFENKKSLGFLFHDCVSIQGNDLSTVKECGIRKEPLETAEIYRTVPKDKTFSKFVVYTSSLSNIMYNGKPYWISSNLLKFEHEAMNVDRFDPVEIGTMVKLKKEKIYISPYLDKAMYVSTELGVFTSTDGKKWYRIKKLEPKKYEIAVTQEGWLIADNLVSKDFGRNFTEFFPSYAFPYKDSFVKSILVSPQGGNSIYLTFSTVSDRSNITLFVLADVNQGWKRVYPTEDGKVITVPVEDTMTSILGFVNNNWLGANKYSKKYKLNIEDIDVSGAGPSRTATILIKAVSKGKKTQDYNVVLSLDYSHSKGWVISDEKWRII